jgi:aspartate kinase
MSNTSSQIIVQKYGGATLANPEKIKIAADRIHRLRNSGAKIVVVVSAMGQTTNDLIELAHKVSSRPLLRELDMLLSTGERISMSLLSMALNDLGCPAISLTGSQAGILTDDLHVNANIIEMKSFRVEQALAENKVVILAGFQGVSATTKEITTLGRGGSDITAVAMAGYLKADRCEILKDVDSVYTADPKLVPLAKPIRKLTYPQLLDMTSWGAKVLNYRSVKLANEKNVTLYVGPAHEGDSTGTLITNANAFEKQQAIAINTFSKVFKLNLKNNFDNFEKFQNYLHANNVGELQLLRLENQNENQKYFISAANENLEALLHFSAQKNDFLIEDTQLSSVSLTYALSQPIAAPEAFFTEKPMRDFSIETSFKSSQSLHFILKSENRTHFVNFLHTLCH